MEPELTADVVVTAASITGNGWPALALHHGGKNPVHQVSSESGNHREFWLMSAPAVADANLDYQRDRWEHHQSIRDANFAVVTGVPGDDGVALVAIDVDGDVEALGSLLAEAGPDSAAWARDTIRVDHGDPHRWHLYGLAQGGSIPGTNSKLGGSGDPEDRKGLEWRGVGGYIVAPGSVHPDGHVYRFSGGELIVNDGDQPGHGIYDGVELDDCGTVSARWRVPLLVPDELLAAVARRAKEAHRSVAGKRLSDLAGTPAPVAETSASVLGRPGGGTDQTRRLDGLIGAVTAAEPGTGNARLNWSAGKAAALAATHPGLGTPDEIRQRLHDAFMARPIPAGESVSSRSREAVATVRSGWTWGATHPAEALRDRRGHSETARPRSVSKSAGNDEIGGPQTVDEPAERTAPAPAKARTAERDPYAELFPEFWDMRPELAHLRDWARAHRVAPWGLLGAVLAHASAALPPSVVVRTRKGNLSLNCFVALCSGSGGGKTTTMQAAADFFVPTGGAAPVEPLGPGSGEGLITAYVDPTRKPPAVATPKGPRSPKAPAGYEVVAFSRLFQADEVGALNALVGRTNSTLLSFLKSAWIGAGLGTANAEHGRNRRLRAGSYRLALLAGVQPDHAQVILDDAGGGFPQRWLWMPTYDPLLTAAAPDAAGTSTPWYWQVPGGDVTRDSVGVLHLPNRLTIELPTAALDEMDAETARRNVPIGAVVAAGDVLDGHRLATRAKVAGLLAALRTSPVEALGGRLRASGGDWDLAGVVLAVSDDTRDRITGVLAAEAAREADRKAVRAGHYQAVTEAAHDDAVVPQVMATVRRGLARHGDKDGWLSESEVRRLVKSNRREHVPEALERMTASGELVAETRANNRGRQTAYVRLATRS